MKRYIVKDEEYDVMIKDFDTKEEAIIFGKAYSKEKEIVVTMIDTLMETELIFREFPIWF